MPSLPTVSWFPGHMAKAITNMKDKLRLVDLVLEIRDARIPLSSCNDKLEELIKNKRRVLILNKMDLCNEQRTNFLCSKIRELGVQTFTSSNTQSGSVKRVLNKALERLQLERPNSDMNIILVLGIPNVGKSTLINGLKISANKAELLDGAQAFNKTARTGPLPGVTRHLSGFKVCSKPLTYLMDTPGVMLPSIQDTETALKLALTGAVKENIVPPEDVAKYLIRVAMLPESQSALWQAIDSPVPRQQDALAAPSRPHPGRPSDPGEGQNAAPPPRKKDYAGVKVARVLYEAVQMPYRYSGATDGDDPPDEISWRLNHVLQKMEGAKDYTLHASQRNIALSRLLRTFREGSLGKFTLD